MFTVNAPVKELIELDHKIFLQKIYCPKIASIIRPGQFLNVKVSNSYYPLLRRPFSVCDVEGDYIYLMFNILGEGTKLLASKKINDPVDILGPLGNGFTCEGDYNTAVIVGGGLGAAPFPFLIKRLTDKKEVMTFIGGRSIHDVITYGMKNLFTSTDDGTTGFKGNVVELLKHKISELKKSKIKIFGCGPTVMLKALKEFSLENDFDCEVSTECAMACGFGICQGCPIESTNHEDKYLLVCKDGPVFNIKDVVL